MKYFGLLLALGLTTVLTACGGAETSETDVEEEVPATEEVESAEEDEEEEDDDDDD